MKVDFFDKSHHIITCRIRNVYRISSEFVDEDNDGLADDHQIHFIFADGSGLRYPASECEEMFISLEPSDLK